MLPLKIVKDNNPLIRNKSLPVTLPMSDEDKKTLLNMFEYLKLSQDEEYRKKYPYVREGIGLAAPQIGILKRMIVVYFSGENETAHVLVNPKIISTSFKKCYLSRGEGCLSVDEEHQGYIFRYYKIKVKAFDLIKNQDVVISAKGLEAIALQHEIDHLDGILFYDHINKLDPFNAPDSYIKI